MIDRTAEDVAQDKRIAHLSNKIDELAVSLDHIERQIQALTTPLNPILEIVKRIEAALQLLHKPAARL